MCTHPCPTRSSLECPNGEICFGGTTCDSEFSNEFFVDYSSGSCFKDAAPCPDEAFTCEKVPPPIRTYTSIEECCEQGQSWVDFGFCTSRSIGGYTNGWVVDYMAEKCVKDCDPSLGPPCSDPEHDDQSAPIFTTVRECCDTSLGWVDADACESTSDNDEPVGEFSNQFFVNYPTGSCFKDAEPCPGEGFTCEKVPPPVDVYESVEECCKQGQSWVDFGFCTSRSVGGFTNGWVVDYGLQKCIKDCDPAMGPPCGTSVHDDQSAPIFDTALQCCQTSLSWVDIDSCMSVTSTDPGGNQGGSDGSDKFFADYDSGSCFQDADPCPEDPVTCAHAPPPVQLYDSIEQCCSQGQSWVNLEFCTSRSVSEFTNGWVVNYGQVKCVKDCDPSAGPPCAAHDDKGLQIFATAEKCCHTTLSWVPVHDCVSA